MAKQAGITPDELRQAMTYDPDNGRLFWRARNVSDFASVPAYNRWVSLFAGRPAFTSLNANGYPAGRFMRRPLLAHRVAWAITYDRWPGEVDHINGDRSDYRIANLREVERVNNTRNRRMPNNNTTGVMGVYISRNGRYEARIAGHHIGTFETIAEARAARQEEARRLGYADRHGSDETHAAPISERM